MHLMRVVGCAAIGFMAALMAFLVTTGFGNREAEASHRFRYYGGDGMHLGSIHGLNNEDFCVEQWGADFPLPAPNQSIVIDFDPPISGIAFASLLSRVRNTLIAAAPNDTIDWHRWGAVVSGGTTYYKLFWWSASTVYNLDCIALPAAVRQQINVEYWSVNHQAAATATNNSGAFNMACNNGDWRDDPPPAGAENNPGDACAFCYAPYNNPTGLDPDGTAHIDYTWCRIVMRDQAINTTSQWRTVVNHETGHTLDLADCWAGTPASVCNNDSIMHSTSDYDFPPFKDRQTVTGDVMPWPPGSGLGDDTGGVGPEP